MGWIVDWCQWRPKFVTMMARWIGFDVTPGYQPLMQMCVYCDYVSAWSRAISDLSFPDDFAAGRVCKAIDSNGAKPWLSPLVSRLPPEYRNVGRQTGDVDVVTGHGSFDVFFNISS